MSGFLALAPHEIVAEFGRLTQQPKQAQIDALARRSISIWALAGAPRSGEFCVGFARIERLDDGHFDFVDDGVPGMAVIALDAFSEAADIVAWPLQHQWIASWFGRVSMLGEPNVLGARLDPALTIHRDAFSWLRDERQGVVLINPARAARELCDVGTVRAADVEHGMQLQMLLKPPMPAIVVAAPERRAA